MAQRTERFYIQTYGCQMNVADTERMTALLERAGGESVARPEEADVILLNTCSVRERPEHKVYSRLGELRRLKQQNPGLLLQPPQLAQPAVDLVLGPLADGAGIEQDHVRLFRARDGFTARALQQCRHPLRIRHI